MAEHPLPAATVPDLLGNQVGVGDIIVSAFTDFGNPSMRVGKVVQILERTFPARNGFTPEPTTLLKVQWVTGSLYALMPAAKTTKIAAHNRRFAKVAGDVQLAEGATHQVTLEESLDT